jgi:pyruvate/2-oxoglutarate dehydrogenase complex dihydrolipoamide dehydrogenase (E3) component
MPRTWSRAAEFGVTIDGTVNVDMRRVAERKRAIAEVHRSGLESWLKKMEN